MNKNGYEPLKTNGHSVLKFQAGESLPTGAAVPAGNGDAECVQKIERSIAFMLEHLDKPLQVATLAARANVSPSHFFVLFKRRTGCPPNDYFTRLRMQRARELLDGGSLHVKEVAAALGYDDPFYFSRVFKAVHNVPPSRYRIARLNYGDETENLTTQPTLMYA